MKKQLTNTMKRTRIFLLSLLASMSMSSLQAQNYVAPIAYEDSYPSSSTAVGLTTHTSAYSFSNLAMTSGPSAEIVLSGWDAPGQPGTMAWRILQNGNPAVIFNQGLQSYTNCLDIEVGMLHNPMAMGNYQVLVAYYRQGVGHFIDVYNINLAGLTFSYSVALSGSPFYTRISMDSHLLYAAAVTWEDGGNIRTMMVNSGGGPLVFSGVLTLNGTMNNVDPDCAFSHTPMGGSLNVHYVYYDPMTGNITESSFDYWAMLPMMGGFVPVAVNDVNPIPVGTALAPVNIDCPDHYDVENWAYTYTTNNADISVRFVDYHTLGIPMTQIMNNGALGNFPINGSMNYNSFLAYDNSAMFASGRINVGWFTNNINPITGNIAGYIALSVDESCSFLLTPVDYQTVANMPTWASSTPKMSFTKMHHQSNFQYTIFPELDPINGFRMQHKYHQWGAPQFKGGPGEPVHTCTDEEKIQAFYSKHKATAHLSAYPNPFDDRLSVMVPAELQKETATVTITNIVGKKYGSFTGQMTDLNNYLTTLSKQLIAGTYLINVNIEGKNSETLKVVKAN